MPRHWFQYGRPRGTPNTSSPEVKAYDSCLDLDLASLEWKDGHINCGFVDDTLWYKADGSDKGSAVVKLSFNLKHKAPKEQFHGVHRCWPSALRGSPNTEQVSKGLDLTPAAEGMGFGGSLGGMHLNKEKTDQSNWVLTSQRRVSDPAAGGRYDMVVLGWEARCGNDYVSFSGRELYAATILACSEGDLILQTRLTVSRSQVEPRLRVSRTSKKDVMNSIRIAMTKGISDTSDNALETRAREAVAWADHRNDEAVPREMANSKPASANNRPEMANTEASDDKTQPIGHICNDQAPPRDSKCLLAPLVYASAEESGALG